MALRYTVSRHFGFGPDHYDLFLETGGELLTWRLAAPPEAGLAEAEAIGDHRLAYLEYEGEISGGRGRVEIHSRGTYELDGEMLTLRGGVSEGRYILGPNSLAALGREE